MIIRDLVKRIACDWEGDDTLPVLMRIIKSLSESRDELYEVPLSVTDLCESKGVDNSEVRSVYRAINYLVHPNIHVLETRYELYNDGLFELSADEVYEAQQDGVLYHPVTNREIRDFEKEIQVSFVVSEEFLRAKGGLVD